MEWDAAAFGAQLVRLILFSVCVIVILFRV